MKRLEVKKWGDTALQWLAQGAFPFIFCFSSRALIGLAAQPSGAFSSSHSTNPTDRKSRRHGLTSANGAGHTQTTTTWSDNAGEDVQNTCDSQIKKQNKNSPCTVASPTAYFKAQNFSSWCFSGSTVVLKGLRTKPFVQVLHLQLRKQCHCGLVIGRHDTEGAFPSSWHSYWWHYSWFPPHHPVCLSVHPPWTHTRAGKAECVTGRAAVFQARRFQMVRTRHSVA